MGGMGGGAGAGAGAGGGAGGGGMPDLAGMLNNPQIMAMAQQMMANGGMDQLMQNPAIRNMVRLASYMNSALSYQVLSIGKSSADRWRNAEHG
jgi:hypothetical protein